MEIHIKTIPHKDQRYDTCGDYWMDENGILQIRVSDMGNDKYAALVAIHELVEQQLTEWKGISEQEITDFDIAFESARKLGLRRENEEPGFNNDAPYLLEHTLATGVEMMMCAHAGIKWNDYDHAVNSL